MTSHYTWESVTTLHILGVCWDGLWTLSLGLSQFHGHGTWLMCEVALRFVLIVFGSNFWQPISWTYNLGRPITVGLQSNFLYAIEWCYMSAFGAPSWPKKVMPCGNPSLPRRNKKVVVRWALRSSIEYATYATKVPLKKFPSSLH